MNHYYQSIDGWFESPGFYREMIARCPDGGTMVEVGGHDAWVRGVREAYEELCGQVQVLEYCWWKTIDTKMAMV